MRTIDNVELKKVMVDILISINGFCKENNITYYLAFGTLLGAIRHKGFIPWDDDLDICMPRDDYDMFIRKFKHDYYKVIVPENDENYRLWYGKVIDERTVIEDKLNKNMGVFIDVFPIDGLTNDKGIAQKHYDKVKRIRYIYDVLSCSLQLTYKEQKLFSKKILLFMVRCIRCIMPMRQLRNYLVKLIKKYPYGESQYVGILSYGDSSWLLNKDVFEKAINADFENYKFPIPEKYEKWLTKRYGNYMELPPIEERKGNHVIRAFWK